MFASKEGTSFRVKYQKKKQSTIERHLIIEFPESNISEGKRCQVTRISVVVATTALSKQLLMAH